MDVSVILRAVRKYWWMVATVTMLAIGTGALIALEMPKQYESTVTFFVRTPAEQINGAFQGDQFAQKRVNSYVQLLTSARLANLVLDETQLTLTPDEVTSRIEGQADPNTVLLTATVTDTDPARSLDIARAVSSKFVSLVSTLETAPGSTTPSVSLEVTSPPALSNAPVAPRPPIIMGLSSVVGLIIGICIAVVRVLLDKTVRSTDALASLTKKAVLASIAFDDSAKASPLIVNSRSKSIRAEAFRQLRTNLQYLDVDTPLKVIAVTSSVAGEGKSSTAANLAVSFAEAGSTVLLVEGDLRRPKVADYLGLDGSVGLTSVLTGRLNLSEVLQPWGKGGLSVLASGPIPPNPAEMLGSKSMAQLLLSLRATFDIVIIDTPPLLPVTDGAIISAEADGAILVVRYGKTTRHQIDGAMDSLRAVDARLVGCVSNMVPVRGADAYGYDYAYSYSDVVGGRPHLNDEESERITDAPPSPPRAHEVKAVP